MQVLDYKQKPIDLTELLIKFREQYRNVYMYQVGDLVFFYRPINRAEYKTLFEENKLTDLDKEDLIVETCLLFPKDFDMNTCEAGLVSQLAEQIIKNSFLSRDARTKVINYYRADMADVDNQIICIIHEAFPTIDIEDMEEWDMERTLKYLSRAEWILNNLRGIPFQKGSDAHEAFANKPEPTLPDNPLEYNIPKPEPKPEPPQPKQPARKQTHRGQKKTKLTPEKLAELKRKYPDIPWEFDNGMDGAKGLLEQPEVDTVAPALRPRKQLLERKEATQQKAELLKQLEKDEP